MSLVHAVMAAGLVHLAVVAMNFFLPRILDCRADLERLSPMGRQIFIVHWAYIVLVLLGIALLCLVFPRELVEGGPLARALCGFLAFFWLLRVAIQLLYYDRDFLRRHRAASAAFTVAIAYLGGLFSLLALGLAGGAAP